MVIISWNLWNSWLYLFSHGFHRLTRITGAATNLISLAYTWRPWRLGGEGVVSHSPPRRKERQEFRQAEFLPGELGFAAPIIFDFFGIRVREIVICCHFSRLISRPGDLNMQKKRM